MNRELRTHVIDWIYRAAVVCVLVCVIYYFLIVLYISLSRIRYPFSLEFVEGDALIQVLRILQGKMLYARPSMRYVALDYPPLYFYVSALAARLLGFGFFPLRLVSFVSSLGCISMIYLICRKEGTGVLPASIAGGFFAATYELAGTWFDVARVDMLALFLLLLAVHLIRIRTWASYVLAGIIFALSCLTKQTNLFVLGFLCLYFILFERNKSLAFVLSSVAFFLLISWKLDQVFSGWYSFYTFKITIGSDSSSPITTSLLLDSLRGFWLDSLLFPIPIVLVLVGAFFALMIVRWKQGIGRRAVFYLFFLAGMIGLSWAALIHQGGWKNSLIPMYAALAVALGLAIQTVLSQQKLDSLYKIGLLFLCTVQFVMLYFPAQSQIPTQKDLLAGQTLVAEIRNQPGDVYVHFHPEMALLAGKPTFASWVTTYQLEGGFGGGSIKETKGVKTEFSRAMAAHSFSMIILDKEVNWIWGHPEKYYYISDQPVFSDPTAYWGVVGVTTFRPTYKMYPMTR